MPDISERSFEETIEAGLVSPGRREGHAACWTARRAEDYDRALCLVPKDVIDFITSTQPEMWEKLKQHHGAEIKPRFLARLSKEVADRGVLEVLRNGVKDLGCDFKLAYFRPNSGLNSDLQRLYTANVFSVIRQLKYNPDSEQSLDMALFLNGLPLFTAELKNPLTGQTVEDAISQYRTTRDHRLSLFRYRRCLAHFAVDPNLVFVTTKLHGPTTRFLPFNKGWNEAAGNPPASIKGGYATAYLWQEIWARDSILELIQHFIHEVAVEDEDGHPTGEKALLIPRYHQRDAVRGLVADARDQGAGGRYLIQHSAGSGKSNTIAWLAHRLSVLHDAQDTRVFDSIIVITDRKVLDRQLQKTVLAFQQRLGIVENIDTTSKQLQEALETSKTIIVSTLQKFPVIAARIGELPGKRFAVIVDEAHSSQSGESTRSLRSVLSTDDLEKAEREEERALTPEEEMEEKILEEIKNRGRLKNVSWFAFTATPKPKTLELFGIKQPDGRYAPFSLYSMRQAIEEKFILDVLANYTTYTAYWRLLKTIKDDPCYDKGKAQYLLKEFVELHPHAIETKVKIMLDHFTAFTAPRIDGQAKAMVVTRSRLHAVRYKRAFDKALAERNLDWKALVAFSDTIADGGRDYTEANMNGFPEAQTARNFRRPEYRFLIVACKFQTGFDEPLLHTMYMDKKLGGVNSVQTLSRLNRTRPGKQETAILDFVNEAEMIRKDFEPYYRTTILSEGTDPNILYEKENRALDFGVFVKSDVEAFGRIYFGRSSTQGKIYAVLNPIVERFRAIPKKDQADLRGVLQDFVRLYAFLSQIVPFADPDLEKFYQFARLLKRLIPVEREALPREIQEKIDMESFRLAITHKGRIKLEGTGGMLEPQIGTGPATADVEEIEYLSRIITELNDRFGLNLGPEDRITIEQLMKQLDEDKSLDAVARVNPREKARLSFDHKVEGALQEIVDSNVALYKRLTEDLTFGEALKSMLFDGFMRSRRQVDQLLKQMESQTLEFKSSLRWDVKQAKRDEVVIPHGVLKTIAAFLNTEGGDLLIGVDDDRKAVGIEQDGYENEDEFMRSLIQYVQNGMGKLAGTCLDTIIQVVEGKAVCLVSCRRSPEPVWLTWKKREKLEAVVPVEAAFYVRSGPRTDALTAEDAEKYIAMRWKRE